MIRTNASMDMVLSIGSTGISWKVRRILAYIDLHYDRAVNLNDAALLIGLHPHSLCRKFKREVGISFHKYVLRIRIQRAAYLLAHSDKSVKEISYEVGFSNPEVFSKDFKKLMMCSPGEYRTRYQPIYLRSETESLHENEKVS